MHTFEKVVDGVTYFVHHNSDWSGEALIVRAGELGGKVEYKLPGELLRACGRAAALEDAAKAIAEIT
jgi:hypothetical protein